MQMAINWRSKLNKFFFELISFSTPLARVINLSLIILILAVVPTGLLYHNPVKCVFKTVILPVIFDNCPTSGFFMDCNCPACGMTRGMSRLLHGDLIGAWNFNRMVFIVFLVMLIIIIKDSRVAYKFYKK
jgi:hypothetical protein